MSSESGDRRVSGVPSAAASGRGRAWAELVRLPNLLTVPGDPVVGFLLAGAAGPRVALEGVLPCAAASLLLYVAGTVSNDCFDLAEDLHERPGRPLPSGRIHPAAALLVAVLCFVLGIAAAALAGVVPAIVACMITLAVVVYNGGGKRVWAWGPLNMGLCRGLSLLLGASALGATGLGEPVVLAAAGGLTLYVASVTWVARKETSGKAPGKIAWLPCLVILFWLVPLGVMGRLAEGATPVVVMVLPVLAGIWVGRWGVAIEKQADPAVISSGVGGFVQGLLLIQASLAVMVMRPGIWVAVVLVASLPVSVWLSRRFYAS